MSIRKQDLRRLSPYLWEIPTSYHPAMQVPVHLYADDHLLDDALDDASLQQAVNVACLPGLVGQVVVMPDVHQGYGMPIGGVMASLVPSGVISPGAIGYDVNCLPGETPILHRWGYRRAIGDMTDRWQSTPLVSLDFSDLRDAHTQIVNFIRMRPGAPVLEVSTEAGDKVRATADHPFWTPRGMVKLGELRPGDQVAIYPFQGVEYEIPSSDAIVSTDDICQILQRAGKGARGNAAGQVVNQLVKRGLLPLRYDSPQVPYLLRLMGMLFGDGSLNFVGRKKQGLLACYGQSDDLERVREDIVALGFSVVSYSRNRKHTIETTYRNYSFQHTENCVQVASSALVALMAALGVPLGNKTTQAYGIPTWLTKAPLWHKRLFLAAFFGAELSKPQTMTGFGHSFYPPTISLNKREEWIGSGRIFLTAIADMLSQFGIRTNAIGQRQEQANRSGSRSHRLRLSVSTRPENLIRLWTTIGFEYNRERLFLANAAAQYHKLKMRAWRARESASSTALAMKAAGVGRKDIYAELTGAYVSPGFLQHALDTPRKTSVRVGRGFSSFSAYLADATAGLGRSGMVWERIATIEPVEQDRDVYDFTVDHPDHNFIANGFVVSNCGVRLLSSRIEFAAAEPHLPELADALYRNCPSGVGQKGSVPLTVAELDKVCREGGRWALREGYARAADLEHTEEFGRLEGAEPGQVSSRAKERGRGQLGTLGAGNHFIEVDVVDQVFDLEAARVLGLAEGCLAAQIHCGSRGFGHQVCTDYVQEFQEAVRRYGIHLLDRELVCAPLDSPEGQRYLGAMKAAANFAFCNRQVLAHHIRRSFEQALAGKLRDWDLNQVYDIAHNMGKIESHVVGGQTLRVCVHRKGATRAFGPGFEGLPEAYRPLGQPVLVPGSMGTASWVLLGTAGSMAQSFGSTCHGAGRVMSRSKAKREVRGDALRRELEAEGIRVRAGSLPGLAEEAPRAYKDVDRVIEVVSQAGIAKKVARLRPVAVIKG